jgi:glutathione synthase/RimK-type ligase-like ATP-grasp enzyme
MPNASFAVMTILILGAFDDDHAQHMAKYLRGRSCDVELFDTRQFPADVSLSFDPRRSTGVIRLPAGRELRWTEIESVYWRNYSGSGPSPLADPDQVFLAENDSRSLLETFLLELPARWVNGLAAYRLHQTKPVCLARAAALGASVPRTLLSNDSHEVTRFAAEHQRAIFKPVQGGDQTRPLGPQHLTPQNLDHLRFAPITLQEEVPGTNIRVFVAGEQVLACEVATEHLDFRQDPEPRLIVHQLPAAIASLSIDIARELALLWTGIDFRLTPVGQYVFLEANPSPMFIGFESQTGLPLTEMLGDLLVGATGRQ